MENFEKHYFLLLAQEEQDSIKVYFQNLERNSIQTNQKQICDLLVKNPYPVLDILLLKWNKYKYNIKQILLKAFAELLNKVPSEGFSPAILKFLNRIPEEILQNCLDGELREIMQKCLNEIKLSEEFYLSLMARETTKSLHDILELLKETHWQYFQNPLGTKEFILYQSLDNKAHFLALIANQITNFNVIKDLSLRNNLIILKLVQEFSTTSQHLSQLPNVEKCLAHFNIDAVAEDLRPIYNYFYRDFKRLTIILNYIEKFKDMSACITVQDILSTASNLEVINKYKLLNDYEQTKTFIENYYMWQNTTTNSLKEYELQTICHYFILSCVYDIITTSVAESSDAFYAQKLQSLNSLLRHMKKFTLLCQILEDILIFTCLRWEHMQTKSKTSKVTGKQLISTDASYTDDEVLPDSSSKTKTKNKFFQKTGFICKSKAFAQLYYFLRTFVTKKLHSADFKNACIDNQQRYQVIVDYITDILWKYALLEKLEYAQNQIRQNNVQIYFDPEFLSNFVCFHIDALDHVSSDDEEIQEGYQSHYTSLTRRKATKKRRRATFSGMIARPKDDVSMEEYRMRANAFANSVSKIDPLKRFETCKTKKSKNEQRSIIVKLMEPPERLAALALSLKCFNDAKQIIENYHLQNSQLNSELEYVEYQQTIKEKLSTIYENYQRQEKQTHNSSEPLATVEQIRNVAARGYEVSKIISVIDHFAQMQRLRQSEATKELIQKHKQNPQYRFLTQFEESNLNAVLICDLIINLPFNRDILTSILMIIKRHQSIQSSLKETEYLEKSKLPKNIGPLNFLENLNDCMRLLEGKSLRDLLSDNTFSLRPSKLSVELTRIKIFDEIFYKKPGELSRCEDLKSLSVQFQNLKSKYNYHQRFCNYVYHLTRLVKLRDPNCEYHVEELLKIDPAEVVGDLIFNCDMTPLEIEAVVTSLNLNLVHVIALNMCPEIVGKCVSKKHELNDKKQATIFNYIANFNSLLVYLLKGITNKSYFSKEDENIDATFLERILKMSEIERLASLYNGNKVIAALRCDHVSMKLLENIESKKLQLEMLELEIGVQEPKPIKAKRVDSLIKDLIREDAKNIYLAPKINDIVDRANLIHQNFTKIATTRLAKELIETTLHHRQAVQRIPKELRQQLEAILIDITIYAKVSEVMQFETWPQAYDFGLKTPSAIFERLLQLHLYKLCYEWCNVVKLADNFKPQRKNLLNILFSAMTNLEDGTTQTQNMDLNSYEYLLHILETFPQTECIAFLETNKDKFRSMALLKYAIDFLESVAKSNEREIYKNYKISLIIFEQLTANIREKFWNLLKFPLLIIEQLVMNAKFEILTKVLQVVREELNKDGQSGKADVQKLCPFCFDKNGNIYDLHAKSNTPLKTRFQLGAVESTKASAFILLNFNLYQKDHYLTNHCIDLLLRIYATKALDYQISDTASSSEPCSQSTTDMQQSLDSLCGAFEMPKQAPTRSEWIRDEEASHCMCCRRAVFTMLMRRHHCRRCGRVVCFSCSTHRMRIPELYEDVDVRICNDCHRLCEDNLQRKHNRDSLAAQPEGVENIPVKSRTKLGERFKWKLSGNITHDKLLREEFCYEHAPSVALCLSILDYHLDKQKCVDLLLFHCRKLEKLIVPNPEVDYELVAKMMNCLALAAKVRGGPAEVETIQEHAEIIISVVQNGCESLIPPDPLNNHGLRKLADSLVQAERWDLALEVHLKCGFSTAGVMAAHGLSCLRVGCFDTAREKFYHCMPKLTSEAANTALSKTIFSTKLLPSTNGNIENVLGLTKDHDISVIRRPQHGPPLLQEILKLIESLPLNKTQPETLQRASIIRSSNTSLVSLLSRRKDTYVKRLQEPALNVLNTLASLKRISTNSEAPVKRKVLFRKTRGFEECIYYVLTYGSHADVVKFLMQQNEIMATLKYFLLQKLEPDLFIQYILLVHLKKGQLPQLIQRLQEFDSHLVLWRTVLLQACRYFETQNLLNSLYQLQILLDDPIRASMTCVKFYTMNCDNFQQQHANAYHLHNAHLHLQTELENSKWEHINFTTNKNPKNENPSRRSSAASIASSTAGGHFKMQMDARSLNTHINTILKQLDVAKFLAKCEIENSSDNILITEKYLKLIRIESSKTLPTLFDNAHEKTQICILILLCGKNIEEGFGLAYRIIQDYKLTPTKIFAATAKVLSRNQRLNDVDKLLNCITSNNGISTRNIDEILSVAINSATNTHEPEVKTALDNLAKKINSVELRISSHIFIGQLKSAYLLANKYKRIADIRKILRHAEATNQIHIKKLCEKKLQMSMSETSDSK